MSFARSFVAPRARLHRACRFEVESLERRVLLSSAIAAFGAQQTYAAGVFPLSVTTADFNRDGKPDLLVGDVSGGGTLLQGNGNGTFQPGTPAGGPAVAVADLNGDGKLDLVLASGTNGITVALGNGNGTFANGQTYAAGPNAYAVAVADVNGDGKPDILVANVGGNDIGVLLGNGNGTFQPEKIYFTAEPAPYAFAVADVNGDGKPDLIVSDYGFGTLSIMLGNGDGSFQPAKKVELGPDSRSIAVADLNHDGKADIVAADYQKAGTVSVLMGNGDGTFQAPFTLASGSYPRSVAVADVNGDGQLDLVVANFGSSDVSVFLGNGNGTFQPQKTFAVGSGPTSVAVADLNGDGRQDLVVANEHDKTVSVLLGDVPPVVQSINKVFPTGPSSIDNRAIYTVTFSEPVTGVDPSDFALALNGVTASTPVQLTGSGAVYTVTITGISGNGTFGLNLVDNGTIKNAAGNPLQPGGVAEFGAPLTFVTGRIGRDPTALATGDLNGDGNADLVVANNYYGINSISVLLGNGNGTFRSPVTFPVSNVPTSIAIADVNGDGKPDLIVTDYGETTGAVSILLSNGNGTFRPQQTYPAGFDPVAVRVADINSDGRLDLIVADRDPLHHTATVLLGNGNGTFQPPQTIMAGISSYSVAIADLNGDGKPDLAFVGSDGMSVLFGNGDGTFGSPQLLGGGDIKAIDVADMNGDGKLDLVVDDASFGAVGVLLGNGNGTFHAEGPFPATFRGFSMSVADLNGDGKPDVLFGDTYSSSITVLLGNGDGSLRAQQTLAVAGTEPSGAIVVDLNHDGHPDIVVSDGAQSASVLLGNNTGSFTGQTYQVLSRSKSPFPAIAAFGPQQPIGVGWQPRSVVTADLNEDGKPDLIVVNSASNSVAVALGNGNGTFAAERTFGTGLTPWSVAVADVNHDGIPDLIVADSGGNDVSVLLGNGNGTFATRRAFAVGLSPRFVAVSDINGDGKPDIIAANYGSGSVSVLLGNGNGTFAAQRTFAAGAGPISVAIADFNIDGKPDLAVANRAANSVSVLLGNGNGTFRSQETLATGSFPDWIAAADVNVDGSPDIVVANQAGNNVGVLLGNGDGTFLSQQTFAAGPTPVSLAVADVNGDGTPDLIVTDYFANAAAVLLGNGDGTFQAIKTFATGTHPVVVAVADLNRDGRLDLVVSNKDGNSLSVLLGDVPSHVVSINRTNPAGPGFSGSSVSYTVTFSEPVTGVNAGDFALALNGLTTGPLTVTPISGSVYTATISGISGAGTLGLNLLDNGTIKDAAGNPLQPGGVSFQPQQTYATDDFVNSLAVGDVNLDGQLDIVAGTGAGESAPNLLTGNGNGTFQAPQFVGPGGYSVVIADVNGDGKPDIVGGSTFSSHRGVSIALGNGNGTFQPGPFLSTYYSGAYSVAVGDVNGDGIPDIVAAVNRFPGTYGVATFLGNGNGTFRPEMVGSGYSKPTTFVALVDINGDGAPALIVGDADGTITINGSIHIATGTDPVSIATGDVNGDGKIDLIVANKGSNDLSILLGNGNGTFQPAYTVATGLGPDSVAIADVNGDGIPDLVVANAGYGNNNGTVGILLGNGNGTFQPQQTLPVGNEPSAVIAADVNGDGRPDIIVANLDSNNVSVLLANSDGSFTGQVYRTAFPLLDTIQGTSGNDQITLSRDPDAVHIDWTAPGSIGQLPINDPNGLTINGNGGNDVLTLDYTNGNPLPNILHLNGSFTIDNLQGTNPLAGTTLEIGKSTVYVSYSTSDPIAAIQSYLRNGYNNGAWNGTPTATTGVITSISAQANQGYLIGYADSADGVVSGQPTNTVELKYTLGGDLDLTGTVNFADFAKVVANSGKPESWDGGAITYDATVSFADFALLVSNYGKQAIITTLSASAVNASALPSSNSSNGDLSPQLAVAIQATGSSNPLVPHPAKTPARKRR